MEMLLRIPAPVPAVPDQLRGNSQAIRQWGMTPEILALSRQAVNLSASIQENGSFKADTVQAGRHELVVFVMPPQTVRGGNPTRAQATLTREVFIPEQPGEGQINFGDIVFDMLDR